MKKFTFYWE